MPKLGVIARSLKPDERRVGIHPEHLDRIPKALRDDIIFEEGYGEPFGFSDARLAAECGGVARREALLEHPDMVVLLPKPVLKDLEQLRPHGVLWGWPHCVQQTASTQAAIDHRQTLIAFEEMFVWGPDGHRGRHTFYKNNEMAGYCAVLHALQLRGTDGHYGRQRKVVILSFGAVSRGAIYALKARGLRDITICVQRPDHLVREEVLGCHYVSMRPGDAGESRMVVVQHDGSVSPMAELISDADILVNGTYQDPDDPSMFVSEDEIPGLKPGCLIIDVSCDEGMGFSFARPTHFSEPIIHVGEIDYYAVDHTPTYLWESATWVISAALVRFLPVIMGPPSGWNDDETIRRSIEIREGVIQNPKILSFQNRAKNYPHAMSPKN